MKKLLSILAVSVFAFSANAGTLDDVKNRGFLKWWCNNWFSWFCCS
tara:strand:+ start:368 stop:505 length:138 start_codon:yes stop_codon:yes gene_type:complete